MHRNAYVPNDKTAQSIIKAKFEIDIIWDIIIDNLSEIIYLYSTSKIARICGVFIICFMWRLLLECLVL